ncbi:ComE operon protein 2 [Marinilactibacillus psychrotolerans]|uniref:ComE operon protein 2 n=1 Tax=Marinilactibacillus psychrotolerans TaxID=191770 RepID=A0AAV3WRL5_9LACT|nr:ComE operon protein 2 [Marinilactibacillus psychrotolerans]GEL66154.1 ComE operon protein 2 [Marinilactibacillus psychrotolerans]GEQ34663.1 competence protein ComEB [Marinilactibacillus psychrotolerans]SDB96170.1 dCMP deaminase [Marinilactibacillus psychrotolerans]
MTDRIPWDQYFMSQSMLLAMRSTCTRLSVGAMIVREKRVISGGYNGSVSGDVHCSDHGCYLIDGHCVRTVHAEMNALLQCAKFGVKTEGADIYVTHFPCLQCTKTIIQAGIRKIYYLKNYHNHSYAIKLLEQANINVEQVAVPEDLFQNIGEYYKSDLISDTLDS